MELYSNEKEKNALPEELFCSPEELQDKIVNQNKTLKEIYNLNDKHIEEVYSMAEHYYQNGRYNEAMHVFAALTTIEPTSYKIALGYASSVYQLQQFPLAIIAFWRAYGLNPQDPQPIFFLAEGLYQIEELEAAKEQYELFIELVAGNKKWRSLRKKAELVLKGLKNGERS